MSNLRPPPLTTIDLLRPLILLQDDTGIALELARRKDSKLFSEAEDVAAVSRRLDTELAELLRRELEELVPGGELVGVLDGVAPDFGEEGGDVGDGRGGFGDGGLFESDVQEAGLGGEEGGEGAEPESGTAEEEGHVCLCRTGLRWDGADGLEVENRAHVCGALEWMRLGEC